MLTSHAVMIKQHGEPKDVLFTHTYEIDDENLAADSVIVRTLAAPVNPSDINQIQGVYPSQPPKTTDLGTDFPTFVCGNEGLYEVVKVGSNVTSLKAGDWALPARVCSGSWRTYAEFKKDQLFRIKNPEQSKAAGVKNPLSVEQGATILVNPLSAYMMLTHYIKPEKDNWFIQNGGNSAVGKYASQMGTLLGLNSISVVRDRPDFEDLKNELTETYKATRVITDEENNSKEFGATVKSWVKETGGKLQLALNCVGGKSSTQIARKLDEDGIMLTYGGMSMQPVSLSPALHIFKNITSAGFWCTRIVEKDPQLKQDIVKQIVEWYEEGKIIDASSSSIKFSSGDLAEFFRNAVVNSKGGKQLVKFEY